MAGEQLEETIVLGHQGPKPVQHPDHRPLSPAAEQQI
jgi:hypothetical protein